MEEQGYLMISGIQHFIFCRRQWALIHIEQQWLENLLTVEGNIMHEKCHDEEFTEKRGDLLISRGMRVISHTMGVTGACDVVEFHASEEGISINGQKGKWNPVPIEYKRGKKKTDSSDEFQLCAQAMCLEEMLVCDIPFGYLFYGESKRRTKVEFTQEMRNGIKDIFQEMYLLYDRGHTPKVKKTNACKSCSLAEVCLPVLCGRISVTEYINNHLKEV